MTKRVLMLAYHFPPLAGGSGQLRTLAFARGLQHYGWQPIILTVHPRAHEYLNPTISTSAEDYPVHHAFALDSSRHFAIAGRYPEWLAQPDRWISWWLGGVPAGMQLIRRYRPSAIWSTFPIATAHLIALSLRRLSGLAWIADQRDPMHEPGYPEHPMRYRLHQWIERAMARHSARVICTSAGCQRQLRVRYQQRAEAEFVLIPNGYDEADFARPPISQQRKSREAKITLLHSGVIYPSERDPAALFAALAMLLHGGEISPHNFCLRLRASEHQQILQTLLAQHPPVAEVVQLPPLLPRASALDELFEVDGLLLLQARSCNGQVPAKAYEYLRSGQPVLALTAAEGDTAQLMREAGLDTVASLDDPSAIACALRRFLGLIRNARAPVASAAFVAGLSRAHGCRQLAQLLDTVTGDTV